MSKWEMFLTMLVIVLAFVTGRFTGEKAARAKSRVEMLTERYLADVQIAEYQKQKLDKKAGRKSSVQSIELGEGGP